MYPFRFRQLIKAQRITSNGKTVESKSRRGTMHVPNIKVEDGNNFWHYFGWNTMGNGGWVGPIKNDPTTFRTSTGQIDKNGREIYQGDVVRLLCSFGGKSTATIEYDAHSCGFYPRIHNKEVWSEYRKKNVSMAEWHTYAGMHTCLGSNEHIEVIGNTDENPELI